MIRKRIKKRRNPSEEEELRERRLEVYKNLGLFLYNVVEDGNPENLVNAIILYNQGYVCGDCYNEELGEEPKDYLECVCEKCPCCGFRRDLCYLDIDYKGPKAEDYSKEEISENLASEAAYPFFDASIESREFLIALPDICRHTIEWDKFCNRQKTNYLKNN